MHQIELHSNMNTMKEDLLSAVVPLLKLLSLTVIGLILAHRKIQIIPKSTFKLLSKLVFALFLPCLIFIDLGRSITLHNLALWWFIPVNVLISAILGFLLGIIVVYLCKPPPQFVKFTIIMTACGNTGNLPIAILGSLCHNPNNPFGPNCHQRGVAYVSLAQWVSVLLVYTLVYHMMEPPLEYYEIIEEENIEIGNVKTPIKKIFQPPIIASFLAILIGTIPQAKSFIFGHDAPLGFITDSLEILGGAMVPSVMLVLGGVLAEGPNDSKIGLKTTIGVTIARLLVLPLLGIGVIGLGDKMGIIVGDDLMYRYVLLLQYATPSAILLGAVARMRGYAVSECSAILFWQHVFALFSLSFYMFVYSKLVALV